MTKTYLTGYKKFMTDDEIRQLLEYTNTLSEQIKLIFHILIGMGLRVGEAIRLKRYMINGNRLVFQLEKSGRTHERIIPNWVLHGLNEYFRKYDAVIGMDDYIFTTKASYRYNGKHEHISRTTIQVYIGRFRKKCMINDYYYCQAGGSKNKLYRVSVHTIRHWFLTKLYEKSGGDVLLVADVIGHQKLETTFKYLRAWKKMQREGQLANDMMLEVVA